MKFNLNYCLLISFTVILAINTSCNKKTYDPTRYWRPTLDQILSDSSQQFYADTLIKNETAALAIAEPLLVAKYGQVKINQEKPLKALRLDKYWIVDGTLPRGHVGGTATVILRATDGKVIHLTHYK